MTALWSEPIVDRIQYRSFMQNILPESVMGPSTIEPTGVVLVQLID